MSSEKHLILDDISHAIKKSFMTGNFKRVLQKHLALDDKDNIYKCELDHSPALLKIIDEVLCNCCDVYLKTKSVTEIHTNIEDDGTVKIMNTGDGIPIYEHEEGTRLRGRKCYWPECCFGMLRAGSNLETNDSHAVAGVNGLGAKLTGIHSDWLELITVDKERKKMYSQLFKDCLRDIQAPIIESYRKKPYTQVTFLPKYEERFYYNIEKNPQELKEIRDIIRYRIVHMATFLGSCSNHGMPKVKMYFLDKEIKIKDTKLLMNVFSKGEQGDTYNIKCQSKDGHFIDYSVLVRTGKYKTTSVINGIMVKDGTHITYIKRKINTKIKELNKTDKKMDCSTNLVIVSSSWLCVDNWGTQTKDSLGIPETDLKCFDIDDQVLTTISKKLISLSKVVDPKKIVTKKVNKTVVYDKYTPPKKKSHTNTLMLVEGDSASTLIRAGLNIKDCNYNFDNTGIFSLGGVPINVAKTTLGELTNEGSHTEPSENEEENDLSIIETAHQKFWDSKIFGALVQALGLDAGKKYLTEAELKTLNYNKVIIAVDQDLDGRGNICSLVLQMFFRFWPHLFNHNFIQYWNSPIVRVIKKATGKIQGEFKYENDFKKWAQSNSTEGCHIMYIKGLATHDNKYVKNMFTRFNDDVLSLTTNRDTRKCFDLYFGYGKEYSDQRKKVLQTKVKHFTDAEVSKIESQHSLTCNRHLDLNTKEFQIAAGKRTLSGLDGMTPVRRKIFTVMFSHGITQAMKLFQIGARAAYELSYHHGDKSINDAVLKMAQDFLGSNFYPLLKGDGQLGTRNKKGTDAGSARYVAASLNKPIVEALFHKDDVHILPKQFDDGTPIEPQYYIPVLPLCILETFKAVAPGWSLNTVGRDLDSVVKVLTKLAEDKKILTKDKELPPNRKGYKGIMELSYRENEGSPHKQSVITMSGKWKKISSNTILIEELPLTITPHKYYMHLVEDEEHISTVRNYSDNDVKIEVEFKSGVLDKLESVDKYLGLHGSIVEQFNFINEQGILEHFDSAYDVLYRCFTLNKWKYNEKINRELLLLKWVILREKNIIKFMEKDEVKNIYKKKEDQINDILKKSKYDSINNSVINTHSKYTTQELKKELEKVDIKTGYNYLRQVSFGEVSDENISKRTQKLKEMEARYKELEEMLKEKPFPGASDYIKDIKNAAKVLVT